MDRVGRRPRNEGCGSTLKRSTRKSMSRFREDNNNFTSRDDDNHCSVEAFIHGGRKYEGS
jgi:hypothetical protein